MKTCILTLGILHFVTNIMSVHSNKCQVGAFLPYLGPGLFPCAFTPQCYPAMFIHNRMLSKKITETVKRCPPSTQVYTYTSGRQYDRFGRFLKLTHHTTAIGLGYDALTVAGSPPSTCRIRGCMVHFRQKSGTT